MKVWSNEFLEGVANELYLVGRVAVPNHARMSGVAGVSEYGR